MRAKRDRKAYHATYYAANKEKICKRAAAYRAANKEKIAAYRAVNKEKIAARTLRKRYGLSPDMLRCLIDMQHGCCAIDGCMEKPTRVDHDHACCPGQYTCGKCIRGVLCHRHNAALGGYELMADVAPAYLARGRVVLPPYPAE